MSTETHINGIDFTDIFTPTGGAVYYKRRIGKNSRMTLSGLRKDDVLAYKAVVTRFCMPLDEVKLQQLFVAIAADVVSIRYFDPRMRAYRTMTAIPSEPQFRYRGKGGTTTDYWTGTVITFEEQ